MLNQEESLVLDERYRQIIEMDIAACEYINFKEEITVLSSREASIDDQHRAIILIRKYLSLPTSTNLANQMINEVDVLIKLCRKRKYLQLTYQALRILINMAFDKFNHSEMIENGAVQLFSSLMHHEHASIKRLAIWGIGNIAVGFQRKAIGQDNLKFLLEFQKTSKDQKMNDILLWTLASLLMYHRNTISSKAFNNLIYVYSGTVPEFVSEAWVCTMILYFKKVKISVLFESGTVSQLLNFIKSQNEKLVDNSLRLLSSIVNDGSQYIDKLIDRNILGQLQILLKKQQSNYSRTLQLLYCLSKHAHCKQLLAESDILLRIILTLPNKDPKNFNIKFELCYFFQNVSPFMNSFKLYSLYKQFNFIRVIVEQSQKIIKRNLTKLLPEVLELGEKFKENGENVFLEILRKEGTLEKWQYHLQSKDQLLVSNFLIIFDRYIYP